MEDWVSIKAIKKKQPGKSNREIGRIMGVSPHTVKKVISQESPPKYERNTKTETKLDAFKEIIFELYNVKKYKGSRIYEEIKSKGYSGKRSILYEYLYKIKIDIQRSYMPYETVPGEQAQYDWSPYKIEISGIETRVYVYSYIHGFSREQILESSLSQNNASVHEALEKSIVESGGVCRRVQTDNAKAFVKNASSNNFKWSDEYLRLCGHYGFEPSRSLPGHPWSKGKVEKPFSYLKNHFIVGNKFESFEDFNNKLKEFQNKVNHRIHSTIKMTPAELFEKEKQHLMPLPLSRYSGVKEEARKVTLDCLISYNGSRYSVPYLLVGNYVWLKVSKGYLLEIYSETNKLMAVHKLSLKKGNTIIEPAHYRGNNNKEGNFERMKKQFLESFPDQEQFIEKLKSQKGINVRYHLFQILEISKMYRRDDFIAAIDISLEYEVYNYKFIYGYLQSKFTQYFEVTKASDTSFTSIESVDIKRDLIEYQLDRPDKEF